ncbi:MAG: glycosyltransferase [Flavobacteriales bacterium]|nr:glycosyltransferase [Flavobacteriales bacterium]MDW8431827.1 glycosyltransferase [Flavobacteriales bacterium]
MTACAAWVSNLHRDRESIVKDMARVLFLSYDGLTDPLGRSQIMPYFLGLSRQHAIHIVSFEKKRNPDLLSPVQETLEAAGIGWTPLQYHKKPSVLSTLYDIFLLERSCRDLIQTFHPTVIHCRSYITAFAGLRRAHRLPFLFDMRGFYADERRESGLWPSGHPLYTAIYRYFKWMEKKFLRRSAHIVSLTEAGAEVMVRDMQVSREKITVIPCAADMAFFSEPRFSRQRLRRELEIPETAPVLVYAGSLGTWYLPVEMMRFFRVFENLHPGSIFLILNQGEHHLALQAAEKAGVDLRHVRLRSATREEMPHYLQAADAGLFFVFPTFSKKASSPVKMGEMLAAGLPVIANSGVGDVEKIIQKTGCGLLVKDFSETTFRAVAQLFEPHKQAMKAQTLSAAQKYFDLQRGIQKYHEIYEKLSPF